jgi:hypothetical protein
LPSAALILSDFVRSLGLQFGIPLVSFRKLRTAATGIGAGLGPRFEAMLGLQKAGSASPHSKAGKMMEF